MLVASKPSGDTSIIAHANVEGSPVVRPINISVKHEAAPGILYLGMHPDIKKLNQEDPPPKGCRHPAYEVTGSGNRWNASYLNGGKWHMSVKTFPSDVAAYRHILDTLYYGD